MYAELIKFLCEHGYELSIRFDNTCGETTVIITITRDIDGHIFKMNRAFPYKELFLLNGSFDGPFKKLLEDLSDELEDCIGEEE